MTKWLSCTKCGTVNEIIEVGFNGNKSYGGFVYQEYHCQNCDYEWHTYP